HLENKYQDGKLLGKSGGEEVLVLAKPGYAVGGVEVRAGLAFDAVRFVFMRVKGAALDSTDSYTSDWAGHDGGSATQVSGGGKPSVGIFASEQSELTGMGLVLADVYTVAEPAAKKPAKAGGDDFRTWKSADGKFNVEAKFGGR